MKLMNTPMHSNKSENLIDEEQNKQQNVNINDFFNEKNAQSSGETLIIKIENYPIIFIAGSIFLLMTLIAIFSTFIFYFRIFLFLLGILLSLILLYIFVHKIILIKDSFNKKILIKVLNFLSLTKMKFSTDLENLHFYVNSEVTTTEDGDRYTTHRLFIINDYKNLVGLDLNESNIKQKPVKCIYNFKSPRLGNYNYTQTDIALNDFVGSSKNYKNPLLFDINTYLEESKKIKPDFRIKMKYIKFSEHFFTYYPDAYKYSISNFSTIDSCFFFISYSCEFLLILFFCTGILVSIEEKFYFGILITIAAVILIHLLVYSLYKCCKFCNENLLRIDFIYSKDYERIFIGVVNYNETKYINTFELQKNNISKFIYERAGSSSKFNLKVLLQNNEIKHICTMKKQSEDELEGLVCFLNGEFIAHTNQGLSSYEQI